MTDPEQFPPDGSADNNQPIPNGHSQKANRSVAVPAVRRAPGGAIRAAVRHARSVQGLCRAGTHAASPNSIGR